MFVTNLHRTTPIRVPFGDMMGSAATWGMMTKRSFSTQTAMASPSPLQQEIGRYDPSIPISRAHTPPSSWYTSREIFALEQQHVFTENWVAVDVLRATKPGSYQTGIFNEQPYLITNTAHGQLNAFYNVCTHAGSCLVGPWTNSDACLTSDLRLKAGQSHCGQLDEKQQRRGMQCPYHGWQFNLDGKLIKTTQMKGIEDFRNKNYDLKKIDMMVVGPIVYLKFRHREHDLSATPASSTDSLVPKTMETTNTDMHFRQTLSLFEQRVAKSGFVQDFADLDFIESKEYTVECNWKVFVDNYGDGCYHCVYAHKDLSSNIDESSYFTDLVSPELSIQHAPPQPDAATARFGTDRTAVYAYMYPNIMYNRYGPWLDVDIIKPLSANSCTVLKAWFLERSFGDPHTLQDFIDDSLKCSQVVHDEDVFLCENVQTGMSSLGYDRGRYVPQKQIATYHFHQRLASDLRAAF